MVAPPPSFVPQWPAATHPSEAYSMYFCEPCKAATSVTLAQATQTGTCRHCGRAIRTPYVQSIAETVDRELAPIKKRLKGLQMVRDNDRYNQALDQLAAETGSDPGDDPAAHDHWFKALRKARIEAARRADPREAVRARARQLLDEKFAGQEGFACVVEVPPDITMDAELVVSPDMLALVFFDETATFIPMQRLMKDHEGPFPLDDHGTEWGLGITLEHGPPVAVYAPLQALEQITKYAMVADQATRTGGRIGARAEAYAAAERPKEGYGVIGAEIGGEVGGLLGAVVLAAAFSTLDNDESAARPRRRKKGDLSGYRGTTWAQFYQFARDHRRDGLWRWPPPDVPHPDQALAAPARVSAPMQVWVWGSPPEGEPGRFTMTDEHVVLEADRAHACYAVFPLGAFDRMMRDARDDRNGMRITLGGHDPTAYWLSHRLLDDIHQMRRTPPPRRAAMQIEPLHDYPSDYLSWVVPDSAPGDGQAEWSP